jgi:hypothetical protein
VTLSLMRISFGWPSLRLQRNVTAN